MKTKWMYVVCCFGFFACTNETSNEETTGTQSEHIEAEASTENADTEGERKFELGPRPEKPMLNSYGEDSTDEEGLSVYPGRDTIWLDEE